MDEMIKKFNDKIAKEKAEILKINQGLQKLQQESVKLVDLGKERMGKIKAYEDEISELKEKPTEVVEEALQ